jgi:hypothetical protein
LRLDARRQTFSSAALAGENYHFTAITASAMQTLAQRFVVVLAGGFRIANTKLRAPVPTLDGKIICGSFARASPADDKAGAARTLLPASDQ